MKLKYLHPVKTVRVDKFRAWKLGTEDCLKDLLHKTAPAQFAQTFAYKTYCSILVPSNNF